MWKVVPRQPDPRAGRSGFTLVELLVVIIIIAALITLVVPALIGGRTTMQIAQAKTEISNLDTAIAAFKNEFGVHPPSRFVIPPSADQTNQSQRILRRIWPQVQGDGGLVAPSSGPVTLNGAECLVLFLGGTFEVDANGRFTYLGFSKNPRTPFAKGGARIGPFYEFSAIVDRLQDLDGNGFAVMVDSIDGSESPYLYLTPQGYKPASNNNNNTSTAPIHSGGALAEAYRQTATAYWKPKDYQLISAGLDGQFGSGGLVSAASPQDKDNITNFSSGQLGED